LITTTPKMTLASTTSPNTRGDHTRGDEDVDQGVVELEGEADERTLAAHGWEHVRPEALPPCRRLGVFEPVLCIGLEQQDGLMDR